MKSDDIARLAGVSRSTVSRVINNYPNVPEKTREKVLKVIKKYNYEPNTSARILAGKANNTIGLFVISISEHDSPGRIYRSTYYSSFINAVVDVANTRGYYVLVHTIYSGKDYSKINHSFLQKRISGGILVGNEKDSCAIKKITDMGYPIAVVDYDPKEIERHKMKDSNLIVVNSMDFEGTVQALNYIIGLGHNDIGIITGLRMNQSYAEENIPTINMETFRPRWIFSTKPSVRSCWKGIRKEECLPSRSPLLTSQRTLIGTARLLTVS